MELAAQLLSQWNSKEVFYMLKWKKSSLLLAVILSTTILSTSPGFRVSAEEGPEAPADIANEDVSGPDAGIQEPVVLDEEGLEDVIIPSEFNASEDVIGMGMQIQIPADFNPSYYKEDGEFRCDSVITVTGELAEHRRLKIETAPQILYYANENKEISVPGTVKFGTDGVEYWYTNELADSNGELSKPISITIDRRDILVPANYKTSVVFSFSLEETEDAPELAETTEP